MKKDISVICEDCIYLMVILYLLLVFLKGVIMIVLVIGIKW